MEHALFATLLHSLWLGILLSFCTGMVIIFTRKSTAALRYNLLVAFLGLFLLGIIGLFLKELSASNNIVIQLNEPNHQQRVVAPSGSLSATYADSDLLQKGSNLFQLFNNYAAQIVMIWFLIICAKSIQLVIGLQSISYVRKNKVYPAGKYWEDQLQALSERLGITRSVTLLQSGIAKVPVIVGHLKPVILIPLGMLNGLSGKEIEAILCHELAHVKRQDYLVNLLQSFAEILFFFNPAVLWISKLIREERENCCDDLALAITSNKNEYIHALISCEEFDSSKLGYAMAFGRKRNNLMDRVSRIVFNKSTSLNRIEKLVLVVLLVTGTFLASAFKASNTSAQQQVATSKLAAVLPKQTISSTDSITKRASIIAEKQQKILELQSEIEKLTHPEVPEPPLNSNINTNINDVQTNSAANSIPVIARVAAKAVVASSAPTVIAPLPANPITPINTNDNNPNSRVNESRNTKVTTTTTRSITVDGDHVEKDEFNDHVMKNIIDDLLNSGIIKQTKALSYKISPTELIVNGVKQNDELHKIFKNRYLKKPDRSILYNFEISSKTN